MGPPCLIRQAGATYETNIHIKSQNNLLLKLCDQCPFSLQLSGLHALFFGAEIFIDLNAVLSFFLIVYSLPVLLLLMCVCVCPVITVQHSLAVIYLLEAL